MSLAPERLSAGGRQVRIQVADTGVGIGPQDQAKLFTQFFRGENPMVRERMG